jgi:hypothetical protein
MLTESARMSSAEELRFRIQDPNSRPRVIKVVALDRPAEAIIERLSRNGWTNATFFRATADTIVGARSTPIADSAWLRDLSGRAREVDEEVAAADLVVMVAAPGGEAHLAPLIGRACSDRRVNTTGLIVGATDATDEDVSRTLSQLRPWSLMVVIANPDDYIDDMLTALRA